MSIPAEIAYGHDQVPVYQQEKLQVINEVSRIVPDLFVKHPQRDLLRYKGANLLLNHPAVIKYWDKGQLTGEQNREFHNIVDHQVLAGLFADTASQLLDLSDNDRLHITEEALIHDWDVIIEKKGFAHGQSVERDGYTFYDEPVLDKHKYFLAEKSKSGIKRATGCDFTTFHEWGIGEYILRAADNSLDMPNGYQDIVDPHTVRIPNLIAKKPQLHAEGYELYNIGTWDKLKEITSVIELQLLQGMQSRFPGLNHYQNPEDLYLVMRDRIFGNDFPQYQRDSVAMNANFSLHGHIPTMVRNEVY